MWSPTTVVGGFCVVGASPRARHPKTLGLRALIHVKLFAYQPTSPPTPLGAGSDSASFNGWECESHDNSEENHQKGQPAPVNGSL